MQRLALIAVLAVVSAGCAGTTPAPAATTLDWDTTVAGKVVDSELRPLSDAVVTLNPSGATSGVPAVHTRSDESGGFQFRGVAPASYLASVSLPGYSHTPSRVEVRQDVSTHLTLKMNALAVFSPFHATESYARAFTYALCAHGVGMMRCMVAPNGGTTSQAWVADEVARGPIETRLIEAQWESPLQACPIGVRTDVYSPQQQAAFAPDSTGSTPSADASNPFHWDNRPDVTSPTHLVIPRRSADGTGMLDPWRTELNGGRPITIEGTWRVITWPTPTPSLGTPLDLSCMVDSRVDVYLTTFHLEPMPESGWTAVGGD
jgi:hypothetical protein